MDLVGDEQPNVAEPRYPVPEERVELLVREDEQVVVLERVPRGVEVARRDDAPRPEPLEQVAELRVLLGGERPEGAEIDYLAVLLDYPLEGRKGRDQGLAASRRGGNQ
jgi:hypothetical protein